MAPKELRHIALNLNHAGRSDKSYPCGKDFEPEKRTRGKSHKQVSYEGDKENRGKLEGLFSGRD